MIKIVEKSEKNDLLELNVNDTICCWNDDASVDKNYLMVTKLNDYEDLEKPYTPTALNTTDEQHSATNENYVLYFYSDLDNLARDIADSYDHIKKVDLVATAKEHNDDED